MIKKGIIKKATAGVMAAVMAIGTGGCGTKKQETIKADDLMKGVAAKTAITYDGDDTELKSAVADFSVELFKNCSDGRSNIMVSPASVISALAMTFNGADENTLKQFQDVLCGGAKIDDLNRFYSSYMRRLTGDKKATFDNANSIWIRDGIEVKADFLQKNADYYGAGAYSAPFDAGTVDDINKWVKDNTGGFIDNIIGELSPASVMCLVNAVYFDAGWEEPYEDCQVMDGDFTDIGGNTKKVKMMHSSDKLSYIHGDNVTGFVKPYEGNFSFVALLPDEDISVNDFVASLSGEEFLKLIDESGKANVVSAIPEFSYDYGITLNSALADMGITDAFNDTADFSGITGQDDTFISEVIHKTHIDVNTDGTKAAAATAVIMEAMGTSIEDSVVYFVTLDRPFVYAIVDNDTHLPVFMGTVYSVEEMGE